MASQKSSLSDRIPEQYQGNTRLPNVGAARSHRAARVTHRVVLRPFALT